MPRDGMHTTTARRAHSRRVFCQEWTPPCARQPMVCASREPAAYLCLRLRHRRRLSKLAWARCCLISKSVSARSAYLTAHLPSAGKCFWLHLGCRLKVLGRADTLSTLYSLLSWRTLPHRCAH